jgi:hypothetical protein
LTVAGVEVDAPVMLLTMSTVQFTVPPPPLPDPLHWVTEVVSWFEGAVHGIQVRAALAAPVHEDPLIDELTTPVARFRLFVTSTVHEIAWPPTFSRPLHWLTAGALTPNASLRSGPRVIAAKTMKTMMITSPNTLE